MINNEMITHLLRLKMKIADVILEEMPEDYRAKIKEHQYEFIKAVHQISGEYLEKEPPVSKDDNKLKNITVE